MYSLFTQYRTGKCDTVSFSKDAFRTFVNIKSPCIYRDKGRHSEIPLVMPISVSSHLNITGSKSNGFAPKVIIILYKIPWDLSKFGVGVQNMCSLSAFCERREKLYHFYI